MTTWKEIKLGEIADITMGQSPKSEYYNDKGLGTPFMQGNRTFGFKFPTFDTYTTVITKLAYPNDIIMSVRAPVGALNITPMTMCLGRGLCSLRSKGNNNQTFLYYLLKHYSNDLISKETGTVFGSVSYNDIANLYVRIPEDIDVQKKIAGVLSALDDKIELNNQINSNLEQQAQALFKSWFIDFEPFGGKMPDDWKIGKLSDIAELTNGKRPLVKQNSKNNNCIIPIVGASNIMGYTQAPLYTNKLLITGRVGTHGIVQRFNKPCWPSDNTLVLFSIFYEYVYQSLKKIDFSAMNRGSTQPLITQQDLKNYNIIVPSGAWLTKYEQEAGRLLALKEQRIEENAHLSELRDTILPKLISGEIDVSKVDIEQIVNNKD